MLINDAYAAAEPMMTSAGSLSGTFIQIALILLIFYLLLFKPQQKRMREHRAMVEALKIGDRIVTGGGIYGTVKKLNGSEISIEIAPNVDIEIDRMSVSGLVEKPQTDAKAQEKSTTKKSKTKK
ncbi:MAG: preprotein translocase subunit YajC [Alphaproteobacteria bacterium]|nr:preprotein translocase subunit YajC [Alphaproteobacteria bacterium]